MNDFILALLMTFVGLLRLYIFVMVITILLSWTPLIQTKFFRFLEWITDPFLNIFRGKLVFSNIDFGPMIGIMLLSFLTEYLSSIL